MFSEIRLGNILVNRGFIGSIIMASAVNANARILAPMSSNPARKSLPI